ncbi:TlyA family RNA methyltransferase [Cylindrospermopsis raciborskii]|uniref:TlyA family RNA methyltransferase n=1 Tax=Cylindrospermopsis raciborskii TaxID=77022 RepID=UPI000778B244|nr:TlyA family RNA methyltransferase [Cylindrospermopsis raciborskii]MCZ2202135.1 TlyA family RNA methyltransferase [Cylindrospermopsis raciborskii PAMP2012]MCZ2206731.1 TlyA family RNA methyltransferase [Cylindrospermopsis raciborskii PAMP2011]
MKERLDLLLLKLELCGSRQQAQRLIQAGEVMVNQQTIDKPGTEIDISAEIQIKERPPFVSRGGEKLAKAIKMFEISVRERICLDGGISTGGFTDCLLQNGAKQVYGIDVGYGQVDWKIRNDDRVILKERTNLRELQPEQLYLGLDSFADLAVVDVSFISLSKVLPAVWRLTQTPKEAVLLVKPQFEVGKNRVGKKGVVRDDKDHAQAIFQVLQTALQLGWNYRGLTFSPITGPAGNIEYLLWLSMVGEVSQPELITIEDLSKKAVKELTTK